MHGQNHIKFMKVHPLVAELSHFGQRDRQIWRNRFRNSANAPKNWKPDTDNNRRIIFRVGKYREWEKTVAVSCSWKVCGGEYQWIYRSCSGINKTSEFSLSLYFLPWPTSHSGNAEQLSESSSELSVYKTWILRLRNILFNIILEANKVVYRTTFTQRPHLG